MKSNPWIEFLIFTRKERIAVFVLCLLIIFTAIAPWFIPAKKFIPASQEEFQAFKNELEKLKSPSPDSSGYNNQPWQKNYPATTNNYVQKNIVLFPFDPNKISADEWKALGLRDRTIKTIIKFRSKGGKFREPADLKKIYGLHEEEYQRLLPYVRLEEQKEVNSNNIGNHTDQKAQPASDKKFLKTYSVEVNKADSTAFIELPGIGSKLANRIINFRTKLGGFYSIQQLGEVYGLPDSTFIRIKEFLTCDPALVNKININSADVEVLKSHPYIRGTIANAIIQFRKEHGDFTKLEDLKQIMLIDEGLYQKITPYLVLQ